MGIILLILEVVLVWRPFDFHAISYKKDLHNNKVAGPIVGNFHLSQTVPAGLFQVSHQRGKSIHWHNPDSLGPWTVPNCFSIRFANYGRSNSGSLRVRWKQGTRAQHWRINAANLGNTYTEFCPDSGLNTKRPFQIDIDGIDSPHGHAATVWLTKSNPVPATVNGARIGGRGMAFRLTYQRHIGPWIIAKIGHGAFAFGCLCTLGISLLALIAIRRVMTSKRKS